ncbi:uncharacterized protein LOC135075606 [Ostrinia nubilalis]|uniref:uncharacterized protein LOC135075606 n=1 Tax=Ostrinia nubilalis TaxID=29057 RepID=UPI0030822FE4
MYVLRLARDQTGQQNSGVLQTVISTISGEGEKRNDSEQAKYLEDLLAKQASHHLPSSPNSSSSTFLPVKEENSDDEEVSMSTGIYSEFQLKECSVLLSRLMPNIVTVKSEATDMTSDLDLDDPLGDDHRTMSPDAFVKYEESSPKHQDLEEFQPNESSSSESEDDDPIRIQQSSSGILKKNETNYPSNIQGHPGKSIVSAQPEIVESNDSNNKKRNRDDKKSSDIKSEKRTRKVTREYRKIKWESDFQSFQGAFKKFRGPEPGPCKLYDTPFEAFTDIWTVDIMSHIVKQTNKHVKWIIRAKGNVSDLANWTDLDFEELMILFAIYIYIGFDKRLWNEEYYNQEPLFKTLMSHRRFCLLTKFLYFGSFSYHRSYDYCDEMAKLMASPSKQLQILTDVIFHLNKKFSFLYTLKQDIAINESLTAIPDQSSDRIPFIKPYDVRSYEICEVNTGYLYKFQITEEKAKSGLIFNGVSLRSSDIIFGLLEDLRNMGHCVTSVPYHISPFLARRFKRKGFNCFGKLDIINSLNIPYDFRGQGSRITGFSTATRIARHSHDVSILQWNEADNEQLSLISNFHSNTNFFDVEAGMPSVKPQVVRDYKVAMEKLNEKNQNLRRYLIGQETDLIWYQKMFLNLLNASVHNAHVLYYWSLIQREKHAMIYKEFRKELAISIMNKYRHGLSKGKSKSGYDVIKIESSYQSSRNRLASDLIEDDENTVDKRLGSQSHLVHEPMYDEPSTAIVPKFCVVCFRMGLKNLVRSRCVTCNEHMCFQRCWMTWHSETNLKKYKELS